MKIEDRYLVMETNGWKYDIPLRDLKTVDGLEKWLCHMTEKVWFSMDMAKQMVKLCEQHFGYKFNGKFEY